VELFVEGGTAGEWVESALRRDLGVDDGNLDVVVCAVVEALESPSTGGELASEDWEECRDACAEACAVEERVIMAIGYYELVGGWRDYKRKEAASALRN
jgi:hypothetical protein